MVVFGDVVDDIIMLLTDVNGGVMMLFIDVVMPMMGVTSGVMVVMVMPSLAQAALAIVGESGMVVFPRTGVVPGFVIAASSFVIGEEVRDRAAAGPSPAAAERSRLSRRGTDAFREAAARAARDLPSSAHALDGLADIVALGKDALAQAAASSASPPSADAKSDLSSASGHLCYYSRFEAQLRALQSDPATFAADPDDAEDFAAWRREAGFCVDERQEEIEALCYESDAVEGMLDRLVPDAVDAELFWARYFYRVHRLKQQEDARAKFVKRVIAQEEEEDLSWELDDEESAPEEEIK
nr:uncharacterized protein LOC127328282 [Lolium perenne]